MKTKFKTLTPFVPDPELKGEYYGIAINQDYLRRSLLKRKRWPMLNDDPWHWRHPIMDRELQPV